MGRMDLDHKLDSFRQLPCLAAAKFLQLGLVSMGAWTAIVGIGVFTFNQGVWLPMVAPIVGAIANYIFVIA